MLIGIDGNEANVKNRVGVNQYAYHLLVNLNRLDSKNHYTIYLKKSPLPDLPTPSPNWQYQVFGPEKFWTRFALPLHLFFGPKPSLFFSLSHYSPSFSPCPTIPTIHDLGYLQSPKQFTKKDFYQLTHWTQSSLKKASRVIAVSEFTKSELQKIYHLDPENISVAYNGVDNPPVISSSTSTATLLKFGIKNSNFFLYLGTLKPNKNLPFLIQAYSQFRQSTKESIPLVIAGKKGWLFDSIFQLITSLKLQDSIIFTDFISETEKWILLKNATCLLLPSLYEGFGIPAIEAQKIGTPVIASNIPPLQEILKQSAILIDPLTQSELTDALVKIQSASIRQKLSETGLKNAQKYTWENTALSVIKVFNDFG
ncbi:MAG: glycosyltransferase family 1 protein [Candidatus Shapirobacteria bacterium]